MAAIGQKQPSRLSFNKVAAEVISMAEPWAIQQKMYYIN
jgi:hypothetical protein